MVRFTERGADSQGLDRGLERPGGGPGEAWRGGLSVVLGLASCGVGGLQLDDRSSRIRTWVVAGLLAWFVLAAGPSHPDSCDQLIDSGRPLVLLVRLYVMRDSSGLEAWIEGCRVQSLRVRRADSSRM